MADRLTNEQLEHLERISLTPHRSVSIPTMQLRQLVREYRALVDELAADDVEALRYLKCFAEEAHEAAACVHGMDAEHAAISQRALLVLDRLIARGLQ